MCTGKGWRVYIGTYGAANRIIGARRTRARVLFLSEGVGLFFGGCEQRYPGVMCFVHKLWDLFFLCVERLCVCVCVQEERECSIIMCGVDLNF